MLRYMMVEAWNMEIIIRKISQRCSGVLRKNKELRRMQFYILIRNEEWEHVGEIKNALLDRPQILYFFHVFFIQKHRIYSLTLVCSIFLDKFCMFLITVFTFFIVTATTQCRTYGLLFFLAAMMPTWPSLILLIMMKIEAEYFHMWAFIFCQRFNRFK